MIPGGGNHNYLPRHRYFKKFIKILPAIFAVFTACHFNPISPKQSQINSSNSSHIPVSLATKSRAISPDFFCFNVNAVRVHSWSNQKFAKAVKSIAPQVLRIPGGEGSNYWDWRRGGLRQDLTGLPEGLPFFLRYGDRNYTAGKLEDFALGFQATETKPLFVLNLLSSTLESQLNMLTEAQSIGIPIQDIELGNEFYFATQNHRAVFPNPQDYAKTAHQWATKIKQLFPKAQISVVGVTDQGNGLGARRRNWNRLVLPIALKNADAATFHIYPEHGLGTNIESSLQQYPFFEERDVPIILGEPFRNWATIKTADGFRKVPKDKKIWITEYNLLEKIFNQTQDRKPKVMGSWSHGLYTLALSLLFLEEPRVEKICNHMLVGNSMFAAIYANDRSFINPSNPETTTMQFGLSATGTTLRLLGQVIDNSDTAVKLKFSGMPLLSGQKKFQYPSLYGWGFSKAETHQKAIVMNSSHSSLQIDLKAVPLSSQSFTQISGNPRKLVTDSTVLDYKVGYLSTSKLISLPAYSVTFLGSHN